MDDGKKLNLLHYTLLITFFGTLLWSGIKPYGYLVWFQEVIPTMISVVILMLTYRRSPMTDISYIFIWYFALILLIGGHYTYAEMPLFNYLRDTYDLSRNHYDRFGHFFQGFTPALVAREVLLRTSPLKRGKWLFFLVTCVCLAISACYELIEWLASITQDPEAAADFVGSQGDIWDAQKDMALCLVGAILSQFMLGSLQSRQLKKLRPELGK